MPPWAASLWYTSVCFGITTPARTKTLHGTLSELEQLSSKHLLMIDQEKWNFQFILVILKDICWQYVNMKHEEQEGLQGTQSCTFKYTYFLFLYYNFTNYFKLLCIYFKFSTSTSPSKTYLYMSYFLFILFYQFFDHIDKLRNLWMIFSDRHQGQFVLLSS